MRKMRLDRLLSRSGVSRRDAAALVKAGRVTVNGQTARDAGVQLDLDTDSVTLNGATLGTGEGASKQSAQQEAARAALRAIRNEKN